MKILFVAAEVAPFSSIGGLSQVMYFLPRALMKLGHDVRIFTAKYGTSKFAENGDGKKRVKGQWLPRLTMEMEGLKVPVGEKLEEGKDFVCNVKTSRAALNGKRPTCKDPLTYFLENQEYYEMRANVYQYADDHLRFALLCKGCLEWLLQTSTTGITGTKSTTSKEGKESEAHDTHGTSDTSGTSWFPDLIHCNDWHTGYLIELAKRHPRYKELFAKVPVVYTVHNFRHQGNGANEFRYIPADQRDVGKDPLPDLLSPNLIKANALLRGIINADMVNTVSESHAQEVLTPEYGEGLDDLLKNYKDKLTGILNGIDTKEFNPSTDPNVKFHYSWQSIQRRAENKLVLQKEFSLPKNASIPLFAFLGRMDTQKGIDLIVETLPRLLSHYNFQFVVLGGGSENYRQFFQKLATDHPDRVSAHLMPDFTLPRKMFAGADVMLIPSKFEPGGIVALEAMRYGAVPLVRCTGGLGDVVSDFDPSEGTGNGFSFQKFDQWAFYGAMVEAITSYRDRLTWRRLVQNCMRADYSWDAVAREYDSLFKKTMRKMQG